MIGPAEFLDRDALEDLQQDRLHALLAEMLPGNRFYASKLADVIDSGRDAAHPAIDLSIYLQAAAHVRGGLPLYQIQVDIGRSGWPYVYPPLLADHGLPDALSMA